MINQRYNIKTTELRIQQMKHLPIVSTEKITVTIECKFYNIYQIHE